jgi:uncharacterized membrane protein YbhN (UPF0104 family)
MKERPKPECPEKIMFKSCTIGNARNRLQPKRIASIAVLAIIGYFWYRYIDQNWEVLLRHDFAWDLKALVIAFIFCLFGYILTGIIWSPLLEATTQCKVGKFRAFCISALAWAGRYIPGRIWSLAGKAYLTSKGRADIVTVGVAVIIEAFLFQAAGLIVAFLALPFSNYFVEIELFHPCLAILAGFLTLALIHPRIFVPLCNALLKVLNRPPLPQRPRYIAILLILLSFMGSFVMWSTGYAIFAGTVSSITLRQYVAFLAIVPISWSIGYLTLITPAGLGVRDSILAVLLNYIVSSDAAAVIIIVIGCRLLSTVAEITCFSFALIMLRRDLFNNNAAAS